MCFTSLINLNKNESSTTDNKRDSSGNDESPTRTPSANRLTLDEIREIDFAVDRVVEEYGDVLRRLGRS